MMTEEQILASQSKNAIWVAGAGCGKSTTLVEAFRHHRKTYQSFAAISFTTKSRDDLKEKFEEENLPCPAYTIHQFFALELRRYISSSGMLNGRDAYFQILDAGEAQRILWGLTSDFPKDLPFALYELVGQKLNLDSEQNESEWLKELFRQKEEFLRSGPSNDKFTNQFSSFEGPGFKFPTRAKGFDGDLYDAFRDSTRALEAYQKNARRFKEYKTRVLESLRQLNDRYETYKRENNFFDFHDLEIRLKDLSITPSLDVLMVDEFQDTNETQWDLIRRMGKNLILVGDAQQSIYAFRGAEVGVFERIRNELPVFPLSTNFRSSPLLLENVNRIFDRLFSGNLRQASFLHLTAGLSEDPASSFEVFESDEPIVLMAKRAREVFLRTNEETVVLLPEMTHLRVLLQHLSGLPVEVFSGDLMVDPLVRRLIGFGVLYFKPEKESWLLKELNLQEVSYAGNFAEFVDRYFPECFADRLCQDALEHLLITHYEILEDYWWGKRPLYLGREFEENANIKIMTIHGSKGLGFKHVVTGNFGNLRSRPLPSLIHEGQTLGARLQINGQSIIDPIFWKKKRETDIIQEAERERLFYVALTRAMKSLTIVHKTADPWAELFRNLEIPLQKEEIQDEEVVKLFTYTVEGKKTPEVPGFSVKTVTESLDSLFCRYFTSPTLGLLESREVSGEEIHAQLEYRIPLELMKDLQVDDQAILTEIPVFSTVDGQTLEGRIDGFCPKTGVIWDYKSFALSEFERIYFGNQLQVYLQGLKRDFDFTNPRLFLVEYIGEEWKLHPIPIVDVSLEAEPTVTKCQVCLLRETCEKRLRDVSSMQDQLRS